MEEDSCEVQTYSFPLFEGLKPICKLKGKCLTPDFLILTDLFVSWYFEPILTDTGPSGDTVWSEVKHHSLAIVSRHCVWHHIFW